VAVVGALAALIVVAQIVAAFVGLSASSFWLDELFTVWVVNVPDTATLGAHILADVHPPLYYVLTFAWSRFAGLSEAGLRLFSALLASLAVLVVVFGAGRPVRWPARVLAGAIAATSTFWIDHSQDARMYALGLLLGGVLAVITIAVGERQRRTSPVPASLLAAFAGVATLFAFTHFYMFLTAGGAILILLFRSRLWRDRVALASIGSAILLAMSAYIALLLGHTSVDVQDTWFQTDVEFFLTQARDGLLSQIWLPVQCILFVMVVWLVARAKRLGHLWDDVRVQRSLLMVSVVSFVLLAGIASSLLIAPSFSGRNIAVVAPFLWIAVAQLIDLSLDDTRSPLGLALPGALIFALAFVGVRQSDRLVPQREEFRAAGRAVAAIPACRSRPIPIALNASASIGPLMLDQLHRTFEHYLPASVPETPFVRVSADHRAQLDPGARALIADRMAGADPCPVLAMAVHPGGVTPEQIAAALSRIGGRADSSAVRTVTFAHRSEGSWLPGLEDDANAWLFLAGRRTPERTRVPSGTPTGGSM